MRFNFIGFFFVFIFIVNMKIIINKNQFISLNESITAGSIIVYHRTRDYLYEKILNNGFLTGSNGHYGPGVYTTYDLEAQLDNRMKVLYGSVIIESTINSLNGFLILDSDIAKTVYGTNYSIEKQLRIILGGIWDNYKNDSEFIEIIKQNVKFSSEIFLDIYKNYPNLLKKLIGVVYTGKSDGRCLVAFNPKVLKPIRLSNDDGNTWTNILNKNLYIDNKNKSTFSQKINPEIIHLNNILKYNDVNLLNNLTIYQLNYLKVNDTNMYHKYIDLLINDTDSRLGKEELIYLYPNYKVELVKKYKKTLGLAVHLNKFEVEFLIKNKILLKNLKENLIYSFNVYTSTIGKYLFILDKDAYISMLSLKIKDKRTSLVKFDLEFLIRNKHLFNLKDYVTYLINEEMQIYLTKDEMDYFDKLYPNKKKLINLLTRLNSGSFDESWSDDIYVNTKTGHITAYIRGLNIDGYKYFEIKIYYDNDYVLKLITEDEEFKQTFSSFDELINFLEMGFDIN